MEGDLGGRTCTVPPAQACLRRLREVNTPPGSLAPWMTAPQGARLEPPGHLVHHTPDHSPGLRTPTGTFKSRLNLHPPSTSPLQAQTPTPKPVPLVSTSAASVHLEQHAPVGPLSGAP